MTGVNIDFNFCVCFKSSCYWSRNSQWWPMTVSDNATCFICRVWSFGVAVCSFYIAVLVCCWIYLRVLKWHIEWSWMSSAVSCLRRNIRFSQLGKYIAKTCKSFVSLCRESGMLNGTECLNEPMFAWEYIFFPVVKIQYIAGFISDRQPCCFQQLAVCVSWKLNDPCAP